MILLSSLFLLSLTIQSISSKTLSIGDLNIAGNLAFMNLITTNSLQSQSLNSESVNAEEIIVSSLTIDKIQVDEIINKESSYITLEGSINIKGKMNLEQVQKVENSPVESVKSTSLLQVPNNDGNQDPNNQFDSEERFLKVDNLVLNGVKQWIMIEHENFDSTQASSGNINGWQVKINRQQNQTETQSPSLEQVYPSNEEDKALFSQATSVIIKEFTNLPEHAAVMVEGQVLINTAFPSKKVVYVKVNNKIVWLEHFDFEGNENCETTWEKIPISFTIQHRESSLLLEIGMKSSSVDNNKCEGILNDNSNKIGLDDFILYVK